MPVAMFNGKPIVGLQGPKGDDAVKDLPTIKNAIVTNISYFEDNGISLPCCVHCINSRIYYSIFTNDIIYITIGDAGFLRVMTVDNVTITFNVDQNTGALSPKDVVKVNDRIDSLEDEIGQIGSVLDAINGEVV